MVILYIYIYTHHDLTTTMDNWKVIWKLAMFHSYVRRPEAKSGVAQYVASIVCSIDSRPKIRRANPSSPEGQKKGWLMVSTHLTNITQ